MAKEDIVSTVGIDTTEFEKGLNDVTKEASKKNGGANVDAGGLVSTLGKAYGIFSTIFGAIKQVFDFVMKSAEIARELRNLSVATGIPIGELRKFELQAKQAGISTQAMAHSVAEFNKNMGRAKIAGSEVNALLAKLGVGMTDLKDGTFDYKAALMALAAAHEAGTDSATLMYYGSQLFGSSFEQLLPIIKQGTVEIKKTSESMLGVNSDAARGAASIADSWNEAWQTIENASINIIGSLANLGGGVMDFINNFSSRVWNRITSSSKEESGRLFAEGVFKQMSKGLTKEQQKSYFDLWGSAMKEGSESRIAYDKRIKELTESKGKKLTPQGLSEAQGASSIQQMAGGDFISAIAFTPLERIAAATEQTAKNTENMKPGSTVPESEIKFNPNLGF